MTVEEVYRKLQKQGHKDIYVNLQAGAPYMAVEIHGHEVGQRIANS